MSLCQKEAKVLKFKKRYVHQVSQDKQDLPVRYTITCYSCCCRLLATTDNATTDNFPYKTSFKIMARLAANELEKRDIMSQLIFV